MIDSPASPDAVLAAIADDMRDWRDPRIPPTLRELGLLRLDASVSGRSFKIACLCDGRMPVRPELRGTVESGLNGDTRVVARVQMQRFPPVVSSAFAAMGLLLAVFGNPVAAMPLG